jgi:hypothetical protein
MAAEDREITTGSHWHMKAQDVAAHEFGIRINVSSDMFRDNAPQANGRHTF